MSTATALAPGSHARWPEFTDADRAALARVLDSGELYGPNAPETIALEREWADYVGTRFALLTNSGTAALHCALVAAGVGAGDEVIVPAFSFVATSMAVLHAGATPVFCDVDPRLHTLDWRLVEERVTDRTRALLPVHVHGLPADMDELGAIAERHGLALVEDAAQAHGATYRGVRVGGFGDAGAFSLNGSKHLAAGEGGLLVTEDERMLQTARRLAIFGEDTPPLSEGRWRAYWSYGLGYNYRSHELTAALARSQLDRLEERVATAQRNAAVLDRGLQEVPGFEPPWVPSDRKCVYYRYRVRLIPEELDWDGDPVELRDRVLWALRSDGVAAGLWQLLPLPAAPVHRRPAAPWHPRHAGERLAPWDPADHPRAAGLLECSIVLGTAKRPLFVQPAELMEGYVRAFEKVAEGMDRVRALPYRPVEAWPPRVPPP